MKEHDVSNDFVPDAYDPVLDKQLRALGHFSPTPDFEHRVMARVHVAAPGSVQPIAQRGRRIAESGRLRRWTRLLAAVSVMSITIVAALAVTNATHLTAFMTARFGGLVMAAWRTALGLLSAAAVEAYRLLGAGALPGPAIAALVSVVAGAVVFSTWALYRLMQPPDPHTIRTS